MLLHQAMFGATSQRMTSLTQHAHTRLAALEADALRRHLRPSAPGVLTFSTNDYLNLAAHPNVIAAAHQALNRGVGARASRLAGGNHADYAPLEKALAAYKTYEAALVTGSGYLANLGTIPALVGKGDVIIADRLVHACMVDAAKLSGATYRRFAHNDVAHAESLLRKHRTDYRHCLILTETVFSMDGDRAPLAGLADLARRYNGWLLADDAHGLGLPTPDATKPDILIGTLSKAAGGYGGYVCAATPVIDWLSTSARTLMFSTALPPAICAAAHQAIKIMRAEPERGEQALANAAYFAAALGLVQPQSAIVPVMLGTAERALAASACLAQIGIEVTAIRPPTVPLGTARLRFAFRCDHRSQDILHAAQRLKDGGYA